MESPKVKFPIQPEELFVSGNEDASIEKLTIEQIKELKSATKDSLVFEHGIVVFLDILGFSEKKDEDEIDRCFTDFPNPLIDASRKFRKVRFNMFSDCAILAADQKDAKDLISAVRSSFKYWIHDGILVRGGICLGAYLERTSVFYDTAPDNFRGFIVSGSGVAKAAKLEAEKPAALLFTDDDCANFLSSQFKEPIFRYGPHKTIGWADDVYTLQWFMGVSLVRALRLLSTKDNKYQHIIEKMFLNIKHCIDCDSGHYLFTLMLGTLSAPFVDPEAKKIVCDVFGIKDLYFTKLKPAIDVLLNQADRLTYLELLADSDSSMPSYVHMDEPLKSQHRKEKL